MVYLFSGRQVGSSSLLCLTSSYQNETANMEDIRAEVSNLGQSPPRAAVAKQLSYDGGVDKTSSEVPLFRRH